MTSWLSRTTSPSLVKLNSIEMMALRRSVAGNMEKEKKRRQKEMDQEAERKQAIRAREALKQELKREIESEKN